VIAQYMSDQRPKRETMTIEESTISNIREIDTMAEAHERTNCPNFGGPTSGKEGSHESDDARPVVGARV